MRLLRFAGRCVRSIFASLVAVLPSILRDSVGIAGAILLVYGTWLIYRPAAFILAGLLLMTVAIVMARRAQ